MEADNGVRVNVLVIEDDQAICRLLKSALPSDQYVLSDAPTGAAGIDLAAKKPPDIILLDLGLPDVDGLSVIETMRGWSQVPIIILSARGQEDEKVKGLEAGADDYVTKPFGVSELIARMRVALRRTVMSCPTGEEPVFEFEHLKMDRASRRVWVLGEEIHLTPIEYRLLSVLVQHAGKVVTHRQLLSEVWGAEYSDDTQYVRIYMGYLRRKIESEKTDRKLLITEPRIGYRLAV